MSGIIRYHLSEDDAITGVRLKSLTNPATPIPPVDASLDGKCTNSFLQNKGHGFGSDILNDASAPLHSRCDLTDAFQISIKLDIEGHKEATFRDVKDAFCISTDAAGTKCLNNINQISHVTDKKIIVPISNLAIKPRDIGDDKYFYSIRFMMAGNSGAMTKVSFDPKVINKPHDTIEALSLALLGIGVAGGATFLVRKFLIARNITLARADAFSPLIGMVIAAAIVVLLSRFIIKA